MGRSGSRQSAGLPVELTSFVGRRSELTEAKRLLSAGKLVTLTGVGGVGKTRLAVRVARELSRAFPDGVWLVPLEALADEAFVPEVVADVLAIRDEAGRDPLTVLVEHLRERRLLLVLDNCEHLLDACARLVETILLSATDVRVLATSRHRLGLAGEQLLDVPPLCVPMAGKPGQGDVIAYPALELFVDRAAAVVPGFEVTARNQDAVAQLCRRLDGLPLAIELAAVRMRILGVEQLVERLDDRYRLLTGGSHGAMPRQRTLRAAVDWSYELCTQVEQLVWAQLAVFAGSFDLSAAEAVCAEEDTLNAVAGLVDKSVLISESDGGVVRYRLLSSLRDYGLEKLGDEFTARRRHRDYYLRLVEEYETRWFGPLQPEIVTRLRAEHDNLRAAFDFCLMTPGEAQAGLRLAGTLWFYWNCCGISAEARHWLRKLAQREGVKPRGARAKAQWAGAVMALIHGRSAAALLVGDRSDGPQQDPPVAPLAASLPERRELMGFAILTRIDLACTLVFRGKPDQAVVLCNEALAVCAAHGEQWARSYVLRTLATAWWAMGQYDSATTHARECLRLDRAIVGPQSLSRTLDVLAAIAAGQGAAVRAGVLLGAAEGVWPDSSRGPAESRRAQHRRGRIRVSEQQASEALGEDGFDRAFQLGRELSLEDAIAYALQDGAEVPGAPRRTVSPATSGTELTRREWQVAELVAKGLTNKQIANSLVIAQRTAECHVENILVKLGVTSRTQLAVWFSARRR